MGMNVEWLKPAAHESYLLSKNSLVTIGVSKFLRVQRRRFEGENGTREKKQLLKRRRTRGN